MVSLEAFTLVHLRNATCICWLSFTTRSSTTKFLQELKNKACNPNTSMSSMPIGRPAVDTPLCWIIYLPSAHQCKAGRRREEEPKSASHLLRMSFSLSSWNRDYQRRVSLAGVLPPNVSVAVDGSAASYHKVPNAVEQDPVPDVVYVPVRSVRRSFECSLDLTRISDGERERERERQRHACGWKRRCIVMEIP